jgi:hypothetical protein
MPPTLLQEDIQRCYQAIRAIVTDNNALTVDMILGAVGPAMEVAEQVADGGLSGEEKLGIVLGAVRILVQESPLSDVDKAALVETCETLIPTTALLIVRASKGGLSVNTAVNARTVAGCLSCLGALARVSRRTQRPKSSRR